MNTDTHWQFIGDAEFAGMVVADEPETIRENCINLEIEPRQAADAGTVATKVSAYPQFAVLTVDFGGMRTIQFLIDGGTVIGDLGELEFLRPQFEAAADTMLLLSRGAKLSEVLRSL